MENLYLLHDALMSVGLDVVAHSVRLEQENHKSASEVLQVAAESHTDSDTGRCD